MPWLVCNDEFSPIILEVARKAPFADFDAFQSAILANPLERKENRTDYQSMLYDTRLTLFTDYSQPPQIDGKPVDYQPEKVYDCPYIQSDFGSGMVVIRKGEEQLVLDFTADR